MGRTGPVLALLPGSEPPGVPRGAARYGCFRTGRRDERGDRRAQRAVPAPLAGVAGDECHRPRLGPGAGAVRPADAAVDRPRRVHRGRGGQVLAARSSLLILAAPIGIALGAPLVAALGARDTLLVSALATIALGL